MILKKKIISTVVLVAVIGGGYYYLSQRTTAPVVQTDTVKRGDISETVSVTGELVPESYADVSFASVGTIDTVSVGVGDHVEMGGKIASLDRSVLYSQLKDARLTARVAEQTELLVRRNRGNVYKPEELAAKKLLSEQARERVRTLEAQMRENVLTSPMAGQISKFDIRVGEVVTLGKVIARVVAPGSYLLESRVPESDIAKITLGMTARITFDSLTPEDVFTGTVESIDQAATVVQDVVSYKVKFRLTTTDDRLKEGMTGNIDVETAKRQNVLWVPFRALTKEGTKTFAEVKRGPTAFEQVEVVTGLEGDEGTIEVKSGLKEGDEVNIGATQKK
ncbi:MAG: efflux RND transporter periplasmic adaptor subunit [Candidatus Moranbacteria bacterium]|jgi:RND family efflux transporter MFP subunit|nr:efflux RND transporter periplasmic adaptor subunit [Candidatus Moranbacteria bacterium]